MIILAIVLVGGAGYAALQRNVPKEYFNLGDKPSAEKFSNVIDSRESTYYRCASGVESTKAYEDICRGRYRGEIRPNIPGESFNSGTKRV